MVGVAGLEPAASWSRSLYLLVVGKGWKHWKYKVFLYFQCFFDASEMRRYPVKTGIKSKMKGY